MAGADAGPEADGVVGAAEFAALMAPLGPFGPAPRIAAGVSGGPHSLALALLADAWARGRGGTLLALIADHGLRAGSAAEAAGVAALLGTRGLRVRLLRLGLPGGPGLQERAREARLAALLRACAEEGRPWLLLGQHRADQAETLLFRALRASRQGGLAAMAPLRAMPAALVLRPLLEVPPARLEAVVAAAGLAPVRDPGNEDPRFARTALRRALGDSGGMAPGTAALAEAAAAFAGRRARAEAGLAERLAGAARLLPTGHAEIDPVALGEDAVADLALAGLIQAVAGGAFPPSADAVAALRRRGRGTLAGAWLRPWRGGWLLLREPGATAPPIPAEPGAVWDRRFRLLAAGRPGHSLGALGPEGAAALRRRAPGLPAALLSGVPAIWRNGALAAVPPLGYPDRQSCANFPLVFAPAGGPVTGRAEWRGRSAHSLPGQTPHLGAAGSRASRPEGGV